MSIVGTKEMLKPCIEYVIKINILLFHLNQVSKIFSVCVAKTFPFLEQCE